MGCCQCIAQHESGGNANALNHNTNGSDDVGLFQINDFNWASCSGGSAPCNPDTNTKCAHDVWNWGGKTWKNWATCGACGCCNSVSRLSALRLVLCTVCASLSMYVHIKHCHAGSRAICMAC